jgi:hypothetical protein
VEEVERSAAAEAERWVAERWVAERWVAASAVAEHLPFLPTVWEVHLPMA